MHKNKTVHIIDSTFQFEGLNYDLMKENYKLIDTLGISGVNFWNSENFPLYLKKMKKNPWDILADYFLILKNTPLIIDLKCNQLANDKIFSRELISNYLNEINNY